jgi:hypothetical protein
VLVDFCVAEFLHCADLLSLHCVCLSSSRCRNSECVISDSKHRSLPANTIQALLLTYPSTCISLQIHSKGFQDRLVEALYRFQQLRVLNLFGCALLGSNASVVALIRNLPQLEVIDIGGTLYLLHQVARTYTTAQTLRMWTDSREREPGYGYSKSPADHAIGALRAHSGRPRAARNSNDRTADRPWRV